MRPKRLSMRFVKAKRERESVNIGDNIADEGSYKAHNKILEIIRGDYRDRFKERKKDGRKGPFYGAI
jgi:hypothetical protein